MKRLITIFAVMALFAGALSAQNCNLKVKFEIIPATCYNNDTTTAANGCDSIATKVLEVTEPTHKDIAIMQFWTWWDAPAEERPQSITLGLFTSDTLVQEVIITGPITGQYSDEWGVWHDTLRNIPIYNDQGDSIVYEMREKSDNGEWLTEMGEWYSSNYILRDIGYTSPGSYTSLDLFHFENYYFSSELDTTFVLCTDDEDVVAYYGFKEFYDWEEEMDVTDTLWAITLTPEGEVSINTYHLQHIQKLYGYEMIVEGVTSYDPATDIWTLMLKYQLGDYSDYFWDESFIYRIRVTALHSVRDTILPALTASIDEVSNGNYSVEGTTFTGITAPGTYYHSDTTAAANGCDSIVTKVLEVTLADSIEIVVEKIWDDHLNNDGLRPDTIHVRLVSLIPDVGTQVLLDTILTHEGGWHANLGRWPKNQGGVEVVYSMEEDDIEGYTLTSVTGDYSEFNNRYTLQMKNWHKLDSITLTVVKVWDDNHNQDGREDVQMQLFHNTVNDTEFDPAANYIAGWEAVDNAHVISSEFDTAETSWANLPKYINGTEVRYAVKEIGCPEHYAASYTFGGELLAGNGYIDTITNRRVMFEPTTLAGLAVQKKLVGRDWMSTDIFEMAIIPVNSTQPMPSTVDTVEGIVYAPLFITADSTVVNDSVRMGTFAPIIFTTDDMAGATSKTFIYHIRELTSALSNLERIVGVTYGAERYQVNITVEADGSSLVVSNTAIYPVHHDTIDGHIHEYLGSSLTEAPMITNRYRDSVTVYHLSAEKQLTVIGLEETLQTGDYHFVMKPVGINAAKAPMPQGTEGTGADRIYTTTNEDDAVNFFDDEVEGDGLRFDYKELIAAGFTVEQLFEGIEFEYEVYEVIPDGATFNNDGTGTWTFTTVNSQGVMVDEIYDGIVHFRDIHVRMEEIDSKVVLHVYSTGDDHLHDYYLSDTGDTTFLDHNSPFYAQHHGIGGVPIFHNKRIARISVPMEKVWDDYHNALNTRPEQITVTLLANGVETDSMAVLNEDNEWAYTFENLLLVTTEGFITYTVREDSVSHYQATYSGNMEEGLIILNTLTTYGGDDDCTNLVDRDQLNECSDAPCPATVTDVDGITYSTIKLDGYCWMAENLRTQTPNAMVYRSALSPDTVANLATYGRLYTWFDAAGGTETPEAVNGYVRGICPNGWHLPTVKEINVLMTNSTNALRSESYWVLPAEGANSTGFNALPAGYYNAAAQRFESLRSSTLFHGDTPNSVFNLEYFCCKILPDQQTLQNGYSVRCVKDCE